MGVAFAAAGDRVIDLEGPIQELVEDPIEDVLRRIHLRLFLRSPTTFVFERLLSSRPAENLKRNHSN
jgi:hypothetical protein